MRRQDFIAQSTKGRVPVGKRLVPIESFYNPHPLRRFFRSWGPTALMLLAFLALSVGGVWLLAVMTRGPGR